MNKVEGETMNHFYVFLSRLVMWTGCCSLALAFLSVPAANANKKVRLAVQWYPQAQFAGYYMAREKGIYAKYGLDVEILSSNANVSSVDQLVQGKADFCTTFLSTGLEMRASGYSVVNVGQIVQRSALMLVARKDSGIQKLEDLEGARVGMWGEEFQLQPRALFKREGIDVDVVRQSPSFDLFMRGGLDAVSAMWYNEYHTLISYGLNPDEMTTFYFYKLGFDFPEDGIYCKNSTYEADPDTVRKLVQASADGWEYALAHPEETLNYMIRIMKAERVTANRAHQRWMLARMRDIILPDDSAKPDVVLGKKDFDNVVESMIDAGFIKHAPSYEEFYKGPVQ